MKKQEEESGVKYQDVQSAREAERDHGSAIRRPKAQDEDADTHLGKIGSLDLRDKPGASGTDKSIDAKRKFEAARESTGSGGEPKSTDSVAKNAMYNQPNVVDEKWEGDLKNEVDNWIQEELYIHGKIMIVDDKTVLCASGNLNDRSQLGIHDSELGIVMTDTKTLSSTMGGSRTKLDITLRRSVGICGESIWVS